MLVAVVAFAPARAEDTAAGAYRAAAAERAAKALKDNDAQAMVECAFALYPLEAAEKGDKPKYRELVGKAADAVLAKRDAKEAARFLEVAGPLATGLTPETRDKLTELATGKTIDAATTAGAEKARGPAQKVVPDLLNPEVKARGEDISDLAEVIGVQMVQAGHPTATNVRMAKHSMKGDTLFIRVNGNGAITGIQYTTSLELTFGKKGGNVQITSWDYETDYDFTLPNKRAMQMVIDKVNRALAK